MLCEDQVKWFSAKKREHGSLANRSFCERAAGFGGCGHLSLCLRFSLCQIFENMAQWRIKAGLALSRASPFRRLRSFCFSQ